MPFINLISIFDNVVTVLSRIRILLGIIFLAWLLFAVDQAINLIKISPLNSYYVPFTNALIQLGWLTHIIGVLSGLLLTLSIYVPYKELLKYLMSVIANRKSFNPDYAYETLFSERQAQKHLLEFAKDGNQLYLLASSANFLNNDKEQLEEIKKFKSRCKLLLKSDYEISSEKLQELISAGVQVRAYPDETPALRGRLKITSSGKSACLFDRKGDLFRLIEIENSTLLDMLFRQCDDWFARGRNPMIRHIIFDLGNVFLDGDFHEFLTQVEQITGSSIDPKSDDYLCASEELNLGQIDIREYVEKNIGRRLAKEESQQIKNIWSSTWNMNQQVNKLAWKLRSKGYTLSLFSNCDKENGDVYELKNYLDVFDYRFFSFDMKTLKPDKIFFEKMLGRLSAKPYECVVVDDHKSNIDMATSLGFHAVYVSRAVETQNRAEYISQQLHQLQIEFENE